MHSWPDFDTAEMYFSWGLKIDYMVNYSITPEQFKQITGKDFEPAN